MKTLGSLALVLMTCGVAWAQTGFSGSFGTVAGVTITFESKLEPAKPEMRALGISGVKSLCCKPDGMRRYSTDSRTHEYFGYDMRVEVVDESAGTYRVTFSALTLLPEDVDVADPGSWHRLPPPLFPAPQIVSTADTMAVDLFENPTTGQKIVDYIRLKGNHCDGSTAGTNQITCLSNLVQNARRELQERLSQMEGDHDAATVVAIKESQQSWEKYRESACANLENESKRLQCELKLTQSRIHDLQTIY